MRHRPKTYWQRSKQGFVFPIMVIVFLIILLGFIVPTADARTPIGYNKWDMGGNKGAVKLGRIENYPDTDSTYEKIDNTLLLEGDSILYCDKALLKTRINKNGKVAVNVTWGDVTYEIRQKPIKLIWINTQTKNWTDVIPNLSWAEPTKDANSVTWGFSGFDYSLFKRNVEVSYQITFKNAFLDSAVTLYNQRGDSQYIALGNVHEYSFVNIDDSTLIDIAEVNVKHLKLLGSTYLDISRQNLHWDGSDTVDVIPVKQRWIKQGGKIYCIEFVMMHDIKRVHEDYPSSNIWHNTTVTLEDDGKVMSTYISSQFGGGGVDDNYSTQTTTRIGARDGLAKIMVTYDTTFTESIDSVIGYWKIQAVAFYNNAADTIRIQTAWGNRTFNEAQATFNDYATSTAWTTAGAEGADDTAGFHFVSPDMYSGDIPDAAVNDTIPIKLSNTAASFPPWDDGEFALLYTSAIVGNCYWAFHSEEASTATDRPYIIVYFDMDGEEEPFRYRRRRFLR